MWLRFAGISTVKWLAFNFLLSVLFFFLPTFFFGIWVRIMMWVLAALVAFIFAWWAFDKELPTLKDIVVLWALWVAIFFILQVIYDFVLFGQVMFIFAGFDIWIQLAIETLMVVTAALVIRKIKYKKVASEGMVM
ncbi:MAG: hypothetical protein RDU25_03825 [Patescibacteria group bacterium]|nr:hypothetical protein [Patescibacteria group bacterium]